MSVDLREVAAAHDENSRRDEEKKGGERAKPRPNFTYPSVRKREGQIVGSTFGIESKRELEVSDETTGVIPTEAALESKLTDVRVEFALEAMRLRTLKILDSKKSTASQ